jgi:hypothetical protein
MIVWKSIRLKLRRKKVQNWNNKMGEMENKWGVELKTKKNFIFYVNSKAA